VSQPPGPDFISGHYRIVGSAGREGSQPHGPRPSCRTAWPSVARQRPSPEHRDRPARAWCMTHIRRCINQPGPRRVDEDRLSYPAAIRPRNIHSVVALLINGLRSMRTSRAFTRAGTEIRRLLCAAVDRRSSNCDDTADLRRIGTNRTITFRIRRLGSNTVAGSANRSAITHISAGQRRSPVRHRAQGAVWGQNPRPRIHRIIVRNKATTCRGQEGR
jgi:hypothetical protein